MTARFYGNGRVGAGRRDARRRSARGGSGECIERPAAILVDTQPRFSGMNFSVCARVYILVPFSRSPFYSLLCHSSSLMHTRAIVLSFHLIRRDEGEFLLFYLLLHLPFPPLPLSSHS